MPLYLFAILERDIRKYPFERYFLEDKIFFGVVASGIKQHIFDIVIYPAKLLHVSGIAVIVAHQIQARDRELDLMDPELDKFAEIRIFPPVIADLFRHGLAGFLQHVIEDLPFVKVRSLQYLRQKVFPVQFFKAADHHIIKSLAAQVFSSLSDDDSDDHDHDRDDDRLRRNFERKEDAGGDQDHDQQSDEVTYSAFEITARIHFRMYPCFFLVSIASGSPSAASLARSLLIFTKSAFSLTYSSLSHRAVIRSPEETISPS